MLLSISFILLVGMSMSWICKKIRLPGLLGMLITGIVLGPYALNLLDQSILGISADLRKIALIIILTRAGLGLDIASLKKIGRPAFLMCFVPATFELVGMLILAPGLMGVTLMEAAVVGAVLAAVSPAVVVPRMVKLMDEGYGVKEGIPQLILAGASVDDVYVIVLFSTFIGMLPGRRRIGYQIYQYSGFHYFRNYNWSDTGCFACGVLSKDTYPGHGESVGYTKHFIFTGSSGGPSYNTGYIFGADCHYVYRCRIAEKTRSRCKKTCCKICKIVGGSRGLLICTGWSNGQYQLSWQGWRACIADDCRCIAV